MRSAIMGEEALSETGVLTREEQMATGTPGSVCSPGIICLDLGLPSLQSCEINVCYSNQPG